MKFYFQVILFGWICTYAFRANGQEPGGVENAALWYQSVQLGEEHYTWQKYRSKKGTEANPIDGLLPVTGMSLNYNPAVKFSDSDLGFDVFLHPTRIQAFDLFAVYQTEDFVHERNLWSLEVEDQTHRVMTTHRVADLAAHKYMNYSYKQPGKPEINRYFQSADWSTASGRHTLRWAGMPQAKDLPIKPFAGAIAEWVLFDRILTEEEAARIESYLAVKYGITLRRPANNDYVSAVGTVIWDGVANEVFHHNIAGIGRDDRSGLLQSKSSSSQVNGQPIIEFIDQETCPDQRFLLWGDNGAPPQWARKMNGQPVRLSRQWLMQISGDADQLLTQIAYNTDQIPGETEENDRLWLVVDQSGTGEFDATHTKYFPLSSNAEALPAASIKWGAQGSSKVIFTFAAGPSLLGHTSIHQPSCDLSPAGALTVTAAGGMPPYRVSLRQEDSGPGESAVFGTDDPAYFEGLQPGSYTVVITDAEGHHFEERILIETKDGPKIPLLSQYQLSSQKSLLLDAAPTSSGGQYQYTWTGPNGLSVASSSISIQEPGQYEVTIEGGGCFDHQTILVDGPESNLIQQIDLLPNPVLAREVFRVEVELKQTRDLEMNIYDISGTLIRTEKQQGSRYYRFQSEIATAGTYLLQFKAGTSTKTIRLVVQS